MKIFVTAILLSTLASNCFAQTTPGKLSFALPRHPGNLTLDKRNWNLTELSAKEPGSEFGIRAEDGENEFLGFLFLAPKGQGTAQTCREGVLKTEGLAQSVGVSNRAVMTSASGVEIATVLISFKTHAKLRAFVASGELCADLVFDFRLSSTENQKVSVERFVADLRSLQFDPQAKPTFLDAFVYATVNFGLHRQYGAVHSYEIALERVGDSGDKRKWQGIIVEQLRMALAMTRGPKQIRSASEDAIKREPDYPGAYLLLAETDAEEGNAEAARAHLQQSFDRRAHTLPGEIFPDPVIDASLLKLRNNKDFWAFVEDLSKQLKTS